jgi:hypothetical protein
LCQIAAWQWDAQQVQALQQKQALVLQEKRPRALHQKQPRWLQVPVQVLKKG